MPWHFQTEVCPLLRHNLKIIIFYMTWIHPPNSRVFSLPLTNEKQSAMCPSSCPNLVLASCRPPTTYTSMTSRAC